MTTRLAGFVIILTYGLGRRTFHPHTQAHVRRLLFHSFFNPPVNGDPGLVSSCTSQEVPPSSRFLSECECREQGTEAVQPKRSQTRKRDGIRQHRASPTLLHKDWANREERVRCSSLSATCHLITVQGRTRRERALSPQSDRSTHTSKGTPR